MYNYARYWLFEINKLSNIKVNKYYAKWKFTSTFIFIDNIIIRQLLVAII